MGKGGGEGVIGLNCQGLEEKYHNPTDHCFALKVGRRGKGEEKGKKG